MKISKLVLLLAIAIAILSSARFGWNVWPNTTAELIFDCIVIALAFLSYYLHKKGK